MAPRFDADARALTRDSLYCAASTTTDPALRAELFRLHALLPPTARACPADAWHEVARCLAEIVERTVSAPGTDESIAERPAQYTFVKGETHPLPPALTEPKAVLGQIPDLRALRHEEVWLVTAGAGLRLIAAHRISQGGRAHAVVDTAVVARLALLDSACNVFLIHNHPGGDPSPSPADIALTRSLHAALKPFDICLADHIVTAAGGISSAS